MQEELGHARTTRMRMSTTRAMAMPPSVDGPDDAAGLVRSKEQSMRVAGLP
jgi:hypothetical protein